MRSHLLVTALLGVGTAQLDAQERGAFEIGGFGKYTDYSKSFEPAGKSANGYGGGGRFGYFFTRHWALEADGSYNATQVKQFFRGYASTRFRYAPFHLRLIFNQRLGANSPVSWLVGAGAGYDRYGKEFVGSNTPGFRGKGFGSDWAAGGITGFRLQLANWLDLRVDGTLDYIPKPNNARHALVSQGSGITATSPARSNTDLGLEAGLSLLLGGCRKGKDGTTIAPTSAIIPPSGSAAFAGTATNCGHPDQVLYTVSGPGLVDPQGRYTPATAGAATVTACGRVNHLCATATVTVTAPAPPPPPPPPPPPAPPARTLAGCELVPAGARLRIDDRVSYGAIARYSDGTTAPLPNSPISAPGGRVSGSYVSWSTPGSKTVTTDCGGGVSATATAEVEQIDIVVRDSGYLRAKRTFIYRVEDQRRLGQVAAILRTHPEVKLVIDGHTDALGPATSNARLGMSRAVAVRNYLAKLGAPVDRMTILLRSFGECAPVAPNTTAAGRAQNRRVEIREFGEVPPGPADARCREKK
jgi:OOP family OmpA-OmpF porin